MSLYHDGTQITIPFATVVPGLIDPTLRKLEDVAVPGGRPINMSDYAANPSEPVLTQQQVGIQLQQKPLLQLGDSLHYDDDKDPAKRALIQPKLKSEFASIPTKTMTSAIDRYRR